jgi:hypothetical protein
MTRVRTFLLDVWDFVVGDDWRAAIGVALALALTALIAGAGVSAWWMMPGAVLGLLALSVRRAVRGVLLSHGEQSSAEKQMDAIDRCREVGDWAAATKPDAQQRPQ